VAQAQDVIEIPDIPSGEAVGPDGDGVTSPVPTPLPPDVVRSQLTLLLRHLVDAVPDDLVAYVRRRLEADDLASAAQALVFGLLRHRAALTPVEHAVLAECMTGVGDDLTYLQYLAVAEEIRPLLFTFERERRDDGTAGAPEAELDILGRMLGAGTVLGVWRAWRHPVSGAPWPPPTPVYVVEAADQETVDALTRQHYAPDGPPSGPGAPLVEIYLTGMDMPPFHRAVQFGGELVHAGRPAPDFRFADVFDGLPGEDGMPQELVTIAPAEAERLLQYLGSGKVLMMADVAADDLMDPQLTACVPLHLRTDGRWVWSDASAYYLEKYAIAPAKEFREHLLASDTFPRTVPDVVLHQAVAWLQDTEE
jgi:hypothetical protein